MVTANHTSNPENNSHRPHSPVISTPIHAVLEPVLGIGNDHYPLPWQSLKYDTNLGGYRTGVTETQLRGAPKYGNDNDWNWGDTTRTRAVNEYYGVPY
jgi:hypothetical protein